MKVDDGAGKMFNYGEVFSNKIANTHLTNSVEVNAQKFDSLYNPNELIQNSPKEATQMQMPGMNQLGSQLNLLG